LRLGLLTHFGCEGKHICDREAWIMDYCQLNRTELRVSRICLGTMNFGQPVDQAGATWMLDRSIEAGVNFIDTANIYQHGQAESMLGTAMRGKRDKLIVATKVQMKMGEGPDESGLSKRAIFRAVEDSLRRLQTDYIDIYYLHAPDYAVKIEESLDAMQTLVNQGKVRYTGTSNYASWQICQLHWIAERNGYQAPSIAQPLYNLIARGIEQEYVPMAKELGVSTIVYNPLAGGLLTGKHKADTIAAGGRFDAMPVYQDRYWHPQDFTAVEQLKKIAADAGRSLISLSLNWLLHHTSVDCVILGASRKEHLAANLQACTEGPLSAVTLAACDAVWQQFRGPVLFYNR
jgi:aryl-alcohol dehydrogenase-like predicted oxidoreductase